MEKLLDNEFEWGGISFFYSNGGKVRERRIHTRYEMTRLLGGEVVFMSEKHRLPLKKDTLLLIPKDTYHTFDYKRIDDFERTVIFFDTDGVLAPIATRLTDIMVIEEPERISKKLLDELVEILKTSRPDREQMLSAYSLFLSVLIRETSKKCMKYAHERTSVVSDAVDYINDNLSSRLDIELLSGLLHMSESAFAHLFKRELGMTPHKYIEEKRLYLAKRLIAEGGKPSKIYSECGWSDYSSFYKAFRKMFGYSPSDRINGIEKNFDI